MSSDRPTIEPQSLTADLVRIAMERGAHAAEAVFASRQAMSVSVREGQLEEIEREESRDVGLRVFLGQQQATVSGSDISRAALEKLVDRSLAMARLAPEDLYAGLADPDLLHRGSAPDLDLYDDSIASPEMLEELAREADEAARSVTGVSNTDGGSAAWTTGQWCLSTSHGFSGAHRGSAFSVSASAIAGEGAGMERAGEGRSKRHLADMPAAAEMGADAGKRAVAKLNPRKLDSCRAPVIFENRIALSLIGPLMGAINGPSVARGVSFLRDSLGKALFSSQVTLVDEPLLRRGLGSAPFDDEGVACQPRAFIDKGVLTSWQMNCASARQLGMKTTGHASRGLAGPPGVSSHNLVLRPGEHSLEQLMKDASEGLLLTSLFGPSLNANTGDWSVGCSGFWFENGAIAYPVSEITVAGNLIDIYARLVPGSDLEMRGAHNSPSLLVDDLAIAGR